MKAAFHNIDCEAGADFKLRLKLANGSGQPTDLSDCTARMQVREHVNAPAVLIELSTENGRIAMPAPGVIELTISAADTAALKAGISAPGFPVIGKCVYDLFLFSAEARPLLRGNFNIIARVTR